MVRKLTSTEVHEKVTKKYAEISCSLKDRFKYPTGKEAARKLGYDISIIEKLPVHAVESFCGVGNPFSLGHVSPGEDVLDVGCGAGLDVLYAGILTGPEGSARGIDLVPEMAKNARKNIEAMDMKHCEVRTEGSESIPFGENTFDVVISNGSIYLSPLKKKTFTEIYRVLKPGGRLQFADVVLRDDIPENVMKHVNGWSG